MTVVKAEPGLGQPQAGQGRKAKRFEEQTFTITGVSMGDSITIVVGSGGNSGGGGGGRAGWPTRWV